MLSAIKDSYIERRAFAQRVVIAAVGIAILLGVLLVRLGQLQGSQHEYFATRADDNRMRVEVVPGVRGLIYDRNKSLLAQNLPSYRLEITAEQVNDLDDTLRRLEKIIPIAEHERERFEARRKRARKFHSVPLKLRLSGDELARFEVNRLDFPGVDVRAALSRHYPEGIHTAHIIGYVGGITASDLNRLDEQKYRGATHVGKNGIELQYETLLHGDPGSKLVEANALGRRLRELDYEPPIPGKALHLSIDSGLQKLTELAFDGRRGAAVALDIHSGDVLAMVSMPSFDPHLFIDGISHKNYRRLQDDPYKPLFNRALQGQYPPGSTIKPAMALAGLELGIHRDHSKVFCPGFYMLPDNQRKHRDWKRRGHGDMNMQEAVAQSCDVYFYDLAHRLGIDNIHHFLGQFGLGQASDVDWPVERSGLLPSKAWKRRARNESWFPGETLNIGIGQGFMLTTPMQLAVMTMRLATQGGGFQPRFLTAIEDPANGHIEQLPLQALPFIKLKHDIHWQKAHNAMVAVIHSRTGTAQRIGEQAEYIIAGKTGTAQVAGLSQEDDEAPQLEDVPEHLRDHSLFIAYAPADAPRIALAVIAEHSGGGSAVAAPIARQMLDFALTGAQ